MKPDKDPSGIDLVTEQLAFYRADATEFDGWLTTLLDERNQKPQAACYRAGRQCLAAICQARRPLGDVLELAAGTGRLTELYLPHATSVVLLDASPKSLELAAGRVPSERCADVTLIEADVFEWEPGGRVFDTVIFAAWLHHVPHARFDQFWAAVQGLLADHGQVIFDFPDARLPSPGVTAVPEEPTQHYTLYAPVDGISIRDHNGRRWRVVHNLWDPADLGARLAGLGWQMTILGPGLFGNVVWATARR